MEINKKSIVEILSKSALRPKKSFGQNFLINPETSAKIVDLLDIQKNEKVLEIGPGLGSLTHFLALSDAEIDVIDLDLGMIDFLNIIYKKMSNINVVHGDILKADIAAYDKIIGNLPYYITTDVITKILLKAEKCKKIVCMIQKEAYPRFSSKVNEPGYSPIGILVSLLGQIEKVMNVGAGSFYPNPHVDSIVFQIEIDLKKRTKTNLEIYQLAHTLFLNKRKTILNNLGTFLNNKEAAAQILVSLGINENLRPENLSPKDYTNLYLTIKNYDKRVK